MNTKRKISVTLIIVMGAIFILLIANIVLNFRNYGIQSAENKAKVIAETIKHSLTSHMVNGVIDNRELFLSQISNLENIDEIWLVRAPAVVKQYGPGFNNEIAKDDIDNEVLKNGQIKQVIKEKLFSRSTYRVTIPYVVSSHGQINCTKCHEAKDGEILGAISISMAIDDLKEAGIKTVTNTLVIVFVLTIFILIFVNRLVGPYLTLFDKIKCVMKKAQKGNYSFRIRDAKSAEEKDVADCVNGLLEKLQLSLTNVENNINIFLTHKKSLKSDPLIEVQTTVSRLSDIYKFRKTIEHDERIDEVYERLAYILRSRFNLSDFNFLEADTTKKTIKVVYVEKEFHCLAAENGCRADRTNTLVDSCQFNSMCDRFKGEDKFYLCIPYSISNDLDFIVSIVCSTKEEYEKARYELPSLQDYIDTAKPEIVSKKLMEILEKSAKTDALTGLFNRKYLEESITKIVSQAKRSEINYGILMVDIDYFKMINDTYGHDIGDEAIKVISSTLVENTRSSDIIVRYGGEEFIVLLYNCNDEYVISVAEKIRVAFSQKKINAKGTSFSKTVSIGASIYPKQTDNFWQCIKYADISLYKAKNSGRNQVVLFNESLLEGKDLKDNY